MNADEICKAFHYREAYKQRIQELQSISNDLHEELQDIQEQIEGYNDLINQLNSEKLL
jgi:predicted  nucleic acid-binding Zn-ribbon protein